MDRRTVLFFLITGVFFGGTFVSAKAGLAYLPPLLLLALRFDIAALVLGGYAIWRFPSTALQPQTRDDIVAIVATGIVTIGATNALIFVGQQHVTSGVASIIASLNPILTPVFAAVLVSDERLTHRGAVGMMLGLAGVALVVSPDPANLLGGSVVGKAVLLAAATAGALGSVLIRWAGGELSPTVRTAWGLPLAAVFAHLLSIAAGESTASVTWTPSAVAAVAYLGVFAGGVAYVTYFDLIDTTGAIHANLVFYVVPVVASIGGWALLGEGLSGVAVAGFLIIFGGFTVIGSETLDYPALARSAAVTARRRVRRQGSGHSSHDRTADSGGADDRLDEDATVTQSD
ncbi:DMT family transporter [Halocatena pleomorpha]|uniref:DMT family transporter n=1 Tax=Halocatena pleomorpha TaxID=1785090 RepID=A0A3P3REA8_9EURY|nr:DMT family transporter [Halocatena pleomorpha]RRJ31842.1 DMT family transporter [Halocatena pleomorpha]